MLPSQFPARHWLQAQLTTHLDTTAPPQAKHQQAAHLDVLGTAPSLPPSSQANHKLLLLLPTGTKGKGLLLPCLQRSYFHLGLPYPPGTAWRHSA